MGRRRPVMLLASLFSAAGGDFSMKHGDFMEFCNQKCWFDDHQK